MRKNLDIVAHTQDVKAQIAAQNDLKVFPNPSENLFSFWFENAKSEAISYEIINMNGQIVEKNKQEGIKNKLTLELCHLPKGIYVAKVQVGNGKVMTKQIQLQ